MDANPSTSPPSSRETLAGLQPEIDRLGIHVDEVTAPAPLDGDPLLVERLVANLLDNAVRHNVVDGRVEVATEVTGGQGRAVGDQHRTAHPASEVDRLFQPFQRLDPRRTHHKDGHGLGLSIVRAIATAHRASMEAQPCPTAASVSGSPSCCKNRQSRARRGSGRVRSRSTPSLNPWHSGGMKGPIRTALRRLTQATRPLAMRSAGTEKSNTSVVRHVGRRSGRTYETPVVAVEHDDNFLIAIPYGERTDWAKNVLARREGDSRDSWTNV